MKTFAGVFHAGPSEREYTIEDTVAEKTIRWRIAGSWGAAATATGPRTLPRRSRGRLGEAPRRLGLI